MNRGLAIVTNLAAARVRVRDRVRSYIMTIVFIF